MKYKGNLILFWKGVIEITNLLTILHNANCSLKHSYVWISNYGFVKSISYSTQIWIVQNEKGNWTAFICQKPLIQIGI